MRVLYILSLFFLATSASVLAQGSEKNDYAILEAVIRKENAINLFQGVFNSGFIQATDSLRRFAGSAGTDTVVYWNDAIRKDYLQQISTTPVTTWDKKKIYFSTVLESDEIAQVSRTGNADGLKKNKNYQILRVSQPLYQEGKPAIIFVEYEMLGLVDKVVTFRNIRRGIYFLKANKGKWKIIRYVGQVENK